MESNHVPYHTQGCAFVRSALNDLCEILRRISPIFISCDNSLESHDKHFRENPLNFPTKASLKTQIAVCWIFNANFPHNRTWLTFTHDFCPWYKTCRRFILLLGSCPTSQLANTICIWKLRCTNHHLHSKTQWTRLQINRPHDQVIRRIPWLFMNQFYGVKWENLRVHTMKNGGKTTGKSTKAKTHIKMKNQQTNNK